MKKLILLLILYPIISWSATVTLNDVRQNFKDQTVFFTVAHNSIDYEYVADIHLGVDPLTHIQSNVGTYMAQIYREMYRKAPRNLNSISAWETWIAEEAIGSNGRVVNQKPFKGKHPRSIQLKANANAATSVPQLRAIILEMLEND